MYAYVELLLINDKSVTHWMLAALIEVLGYCRQCSNLKKQGCLDGSIFDRWKPELTTIVNFESREKLVCSVSTFQVREQLTGVEAFCQHSLLALA